jgi:hypothetical protein
MLTLYVDPTPGGPEPGTGVVKSDTDLTVGSNLGINSLVVYSTGAFALDEIRVGSTFADVTATAIPEPSTAVLAALGGAVLFWNSRRRSRSRNQHKEKLAAGVRTG